MVWRKIGEKRLKLDLYFDFDNLNGLKSNIILNRELPVPEYTTHNISARICGCTRMDFWFREWVLERKRIPCSI